MTARLPIGSLLAPLALPTRFSLLAALALLPACSSRAAPSRGVDEGVQPQPFTADLTAQVTDMKCADEACTALGTFDGRCSVPSTWVIRFDLSGASDVLGSITGWAEHCSQITWAAPGVPETAVYGDGRMLITTADGSTITGTYADGTSGVDASGPWFQDRFLFTGGTGRYASVRGGGVERGRFTAMDAPMTMRMEGWIR
jgi:hypothetical protein